MIAFRDFKPEVASSSFLKGKEYETFDKAVEAANDWINANGIKVINIESVLIPVSVSGEAAADAGSLQGYEIGGFSSFWQILRVWYEK